MAVLHGPRLRQRLRCLSDLPLEAFPALHGEQAEANGGHGVEDVDCSNEKDEQVGLVDELALPDWLLSIRAGVLDSFR